MGTNRSLSDEALLAQVAGGGAEAFRTLLERYGSFVYSLGFRILGRREDAEDLAQIAWIRILQSASAFRDRGDGSARAWIAQVALNKARNMRRQQARSAARETALHRERTEPVTEPPVGAGIETRELQSILEEAVQDLPERLQEPLLLHYYQGMRQREVAQALDRPEGTIHSQIQEAVGLLRQGLGARGVAVPVAVLVSAMVATPLLAAPPALGSTLASLPTGIAPAGAAAYVGSSLVQIGGITMKAAYTVVIAVAVAAGAVGVLIGKRSGGGASVRTGEPGPLPSGPSAASARRIRDLEAENSRLSSRVRSLETHEKERAAEAAAREAGETMLQQIDPAPTGRSPQRYDRAALQQRYLQALETKDLDRYMEVQRQILEQEDFDFYFKLVEREGNVGGERIGQLEHELAQVPGYDAKLGDVLGSLGGGKVERWVAFLLKQDFKDINQYLWKMNLISPRAGFTDPARAKRYIWDAYAQHAAHPDRSGLFLETLASWYKDEDAMGRIVEGLKKGERDLSDHYASLSSFVSKPAFAPDIAEQCIARARTAHIASEGRDLGSVLGRLDPAGREQVALEMVQSAATRSPAEREGIRQMLTAMGLDAYAGQIPR